MLKQVLLLLLSCCVVSYTFATQRDIDRHIEVVMRQLGHELLMSTGDSTSRVLPVTKVGNRFQIQFDTHFQFRSSDLIGKADSVLSAAEIGSTYRIEMEDCNSKEVIYSFEVAPSEERDLIPCKSRIQPMACYNLFVTLLDPPQSQTKESNVGWFDFRLLILLILLSGGLIYFFQRRTKKDAPVNPDLIQLGKYIFDKRNMLLSFGNSTTELTSKESDLLVTLHSSANSTLERDVILNTVWGDEGDYVGRTLDVFISKLRKKLEEDPSIKIANIRGVGYKLILNDPTE